MFKFLTNFSFYLPSCGCAEMLCGSGADWQLRNLLESDVSWNFSVSELGIEFDLYSLIDGAAELLISWLPDDGDAILFG